MIYNFLAAPNRRSIEEEISCPIYEKGDRKRSDAVDGWGIPRSTKRSLLEKFC